MSTSQATATIQYVSLSVGNTEKEIQNSIDVLADFVIERWLEEQEVKRKISQTKTSVSQTTLEIPTPKSEVRQRTRPPIKQQISPDSQELPSPQSLSQLKEAFDSTISD